MTKKDRLKIYESFFHNMQHASVIGNDRKIADGFNLIWDWSYSHRFGNGQLSNYEQKKCVERVISKMKDF